MCSASAGSHDTGHGATAACPKPRLGGPGGILNGKGPLHQAQHAGVDPGFLTLAREPLLAGLDRFQNRAGTAGQIVHERAKRIGLRGRDGGSRCRFVPLGFADGLGGDSGTDSRLHITERQPDGCV